MLDGKSKMRTRVARLRASVSPSRKYGRDARHRCRNNHAATKQCQAQEINMNSGTHETLKGYYDGIKQKSGWQDFVSDDIAFAGTGVKATRGKPAFVESNSQFLRAVETSQVKEM